MNLQHYEEFKQALAQYHMSARAQGALKDLRLVLLLAPTSTGRNTVIRYLAENKGYHYLVSDTTRPPRINDGVMEQSGREYWFRPEEEMLNDLYAGEYLEAELIHNQQVSGISIRELEEAKQGNRIAITDIELVGMHNVLKVKPDTTAIMLLPPSFDEWQRRITKRGKMTDTEFKRRLETAERILEDGLQKRDYHYVIAENVEQSAGLIDGIAKGQPNPHQDRARGLIIQLQEQLRHKLTSPSI